MAVEAWREDSESSRLVSVDRYIRYTASLGGQISGIGTLSTSKRVHIVTTWLAVFWFLWQLATVISGVAYTRTFTLDVFAHIQQLIEILTVFVILTIKSQRECGLVDYYKRLADTENHLTKLGVIIRYKRLQIAFKIILAAVLLGTAGFIAFRAMDFSMRQPFDPLFAKESLQRNIDNEAALSALNIFGYIGVTGLICNWILSIFYFLTVCIVLLTILEDYQKKLEEDIINSPERVMEQIESYRLAHLKLCELVSSVDSKFSVIVGLHLGSAVINSLIYLYLAAVNANDSSDLLVLLYAFGGQSFCLCSITILSHKVSTATAAGYGSLMKITFDQNKHSLSQYQNVQMQLFRSRMSKPESLSAIGLFDINKELGLTIVSLLISYFVIMLQFNTSVAACTCVTQCDNSTNTTTFQL